MCPGAELSRMPTLHLDPPWAPGCESARCRITGSWFLWKYCPNKYVPRCFLSLFQIPKSRAWKHLYMGPVNSLGFAAHMVNLCDSHRQLANKWHDCVSIKVDLWTLKFAFFSCVAGYCFSFSPTISKCKNLSLAWVYYKTWHGEG